MAVYFIEGAGLIKIGYSGDPESRIEQLRSASPVPLEKLFVMPGDREVEAFFHQKFNKHRRHGEWFAGEEEIREFIDALSVVFDGYETLPNNLIANSDKDEEQLIKTMLNNGESKSSICRALGGNRNERWAQITSIEEEYMFDERDMQLIRKWLAEGQSANWIYDQLGGNRNEMLAKIRKIKNGGHNES